MLIERRVFLQLLTATPLAFCGCAGAIEYFPESEFEDSFSKSSFTHQLSLMKEPSLYHAQSIYAVRVTYFDGPVRNYLLRIEKSASGEITAVFKNFSFSSAELNPNPTSVISRTLTDEQFSRLLDEVRRQNFFALGPPNKFATSGGVYLTEVFDGKRYHLTDRTYTGDAAWQIARVAGEIAQVPDFQN